MSGFGPAVTPDLIECYFDSQELDVLGVSPPDKGKAVVELSGLKGNTIICSCL